MPAKNTRTKKHKFIGAPAPKAAPVPAAMPRPLLTSAHPGVTCRHIFFQVHLMLKNHFNFTPAIIHVFIDKRVGGRESRTERGDAGWGMGDGAMARVKATVTHAQKAAYIYIHVYIYIYMYMYIYIYTTRLGNKHTQRQGQRHRHRRRHRHIYQGKTRGADMHSRISHKKWTWSEGKHTLVHEKEKIWRKKKRSNRQYMPVEICHKLHPIPEKPCTCSHHATCKTFDNIAMQQVYATSKRILSSL